MIELLIGVPVLLLGILLLLCFSAEIMGLAIISFWVWLAYMVGSTILS